jgi:2-desacetyl-2-hydroxyethyl bacteriochlorophyllide A dehydrogenase
MRVLCVISPNNIVIEERPVPQISTANEVLLKIKAGGICGSDLHIFHGSSPVAIYPRVIGHEIAGEILEKGAEVISFDVGDRVVIDPVISCGDCYQCKIGRRNVCSKLKVRGVHVDGGYQEYLVVPQQCIYKIPNNLSWEEAVMIEPFTIAEQVCSRAELTKDDFVFIMGAGPVGLSILKMVKLYNATCVISDVFGYKLEIAKRYGADAVINASEVDVKKEISRLTDSNGATVVVDAVCSQNSLEHALNYVCSAGRVITLGFGKEPSAVNQLSITAREIDVLGSRLHNDKFPNVIDHFVSNRLNATDMITHRFPFTKVHEAFAPIEDPDVHNGKVVLLFS